MIDLAGEQGPRLLQRLAGADVPQEHREHRFVVDARPRDGGVDRELLAVSAQAADFTPGAHGPGRDALGEEGLDVPAMVQSEALGNQAREWCAENVPRRHAEHPLGGRIEQHDALIAVDRHDGVHRRFDDPPGASL